MTTFDVAILGAGPAGIAAAIQLNRHGITPIIFGCASVGGLLRNANLVENYPGFPRGISGAGIVKLLEIQLLDAHAVMVSQPALSLDFNGREFAITTESQSFTSKYILLATGTKAKIPPVPGLSEALGRRAFSEILPVCDVKGKRVAIVGAGDAAFDYALNLAKHNTAEIFNRGERVSCLQLLWDRANKSDSITYHERCVLHRVSHDADKINLQWLQNGAFWDGVYDYLLIAIGRVPNLYCLSDSLVSRLPELEREGLFYKIGDVGNGRFRQASIAMGQGIEAAMKIAGKLTGLNT